MIHQLHLALVLLLAACSAPPAAAPATVPNPRPATPAAPHAASAPTVAGSSDGYWRCEKALRAALKAAEVPGNPDASTTAKDAVEACRGVHEANFAAAEKLAGRFPAP